MLIKTLSLRKLANRTIRSIMAVLKNAFDCAVEYEYIDKNPCRKNEAAKVQWKW